MRWARSVINCSMGCLCAVAIALCILSGGAYGQLTVPEVSIPSGAAVYSYPITVPPGALAPNLTLRYNSQRKLSWVGMGWDLDVGYIQRSTKWGVDYNNNGEDPTKPAFIASINGSTSELVRKSDWDSVGLTCFSAKTEGDSTKYCRTVNQGWEVTTVDGATYYFGRTFDSQVTFFPPASPTGPSAVVFKWCLDRVQDPNGNYMTVSYSKPMYEMYLTRINYNFKDGSPANWIVFNSSYMPSLEDEAPQYAANYEFAILKKLTSIEIYGLDSSGAGALSKSYALTYNTYCPEGAACFYHFPSLLLSVTEQAGDGTTLPPVTFTYQSSTMDFTTTTTSYIPIWYGAILYNSSAWKGFNLTGDFDGDGRTDFASWMGGIDRGKQLFISLSRNKGQDQFDVRQWPQNSRGNFSAYGGHPRLWAGDFNGDGMTDIATIDATGAIYVFISTGTDFMNGAQWNKWASGSEKPNKEAHTNPSFIRVGDFNGDGKSDLMSWIADKKGTRVRIFLSNPVNNEFDTQDWESDFCCNNKGMLLWLGDFNGDGKTDVAAWNEKRPGTELIMHMSTGSGFDKTVWMATAPARFHNDATYGPLVWLGDFNGDGKTDIASWNSRTAGRSLWIHTSSGNSFVSHEALLDPRRPLNKNPKYGPFLGDFDGDGRTDMATIKNGTTIDMYRSMGYEFEVLKLFADVRGDASNGGRIWVGDFDGDGRSDIAAWNQKYTRVGESTVTLSMHYYRGIPVRYLLKEVNNGIGGKSTIEYKSSSACNNIDDVSGVPEIPCFPHYPSDLYFNNFPFTIPIVDKISTDGISDNVSTSTYDYDSGLYVRTATEREFYGFKNIRATHSSGMAK